MDLRSALDRQHGTQSREPLPLRADRGDRAPRPGACRREPPDRVGPESLLADLAGCSDGAELGSVLGGWLERVFEPLGCCVLVRYGAELRPVHGAGGAQTPPTHRQLMQPIRRGERVLGLIRLDAPARTGAARRQWLAVAAQAAAAELARIEAQAALRDAERHAESLARYVPQVISERIGRDERIHTGESEISVLFLDIRSYTAHVALLRCSQVFRLLNRYVRAASGVIRRHGGTVVEFSGDGMMAVFGAPEPLPRREHDALEAALELVDAVPPTLRRSRTCRDASSPPVGIGVGLASGRGYVGAIASDDRLIWSAVGSTTNLASRLESLTRELHVPLVVDAATYEAAGATRGGFEPRPCTRIRGFEEPVDLFVLPRHANASDSTTGW